jgi:Tol biopolymer transport system component
MNTPGSNRDPIFTPDGQRIVYAADRDGSVELFSLSADGRGDVERLAVFADRSIASSRRPGRPTAHGCSLR